MTDTRYFSGDREIRNAAEETLGHTMATSAHNENTDEFVHQTPNQALIIGSGIAGVAAALCLKKAGIESTVFESCAVPRVNSGSFFAIHPNGRDVLETLDAADNVLLEGVPTHEFSFSNHNGPITTIPTDIVTIARGAVARALLEEASRQGIDVQYGKKLTDVAQNENQVTVGFADGSKAEGAYLIGADGIHSKTRRIVFGESPRPYYNGTVRSSAITKNSLELQPTNGMTNMIIGKSAFFSYLVRQDGYINWFSNRFDIQEPSRGEIEAIEQADWKADLLHIYEDDDPIINSIVATTDAEIHKYAVYDMPLIDSWHKDLVCLIGDAAHAPSPKAGQGASMALEDAITIAKCLRDIPDAQHAFATFESLRKDRVETFYQKTRQSGESKLSRALAGSLIANLILPHSLRAAARLTSDMYDFHIDWDEPVQDIG